MMSAGFGGSPDGAVVNVALRVTSVLLDAVLEASGIDGRRDLLERLRGALGDLFLAKDAGSDDPALDASLHAAAARLLEVHGLLVLSGADVLVPHAAPLAAVARDLQLAADRLVVRVLERGVRSRGGRGDAEPAPRELLASGDLPRVQIIARAVVLPAFPDEPSSSDAPAAPLPPPAAPGPPASLDELLERKAAPKTPPPAEPAAPPSPPRAAALPPRFAPAEQRRRLARAAFDDVTSLCLLRRPNPGESWLSQVSFERRLLSHLDALLSLGDVGLSEPVLSLAEVDVPDEARSTAAALVLGSVAGSDASGLLLRLARGAVGPDLAGFATGMLLAPSPDLDVALTEAVVAAWPPEAAFALRTLARRGTLPVAMLPELLARRDDVLDGAVGFALGIAGSQARAHGFLLDLALPERADEVFLPALQSLLRRRHPTARELLQVALAAEEGSVRAESALTFLGAAGSASDAEALAARAERAPRLDIVKILGQLGAVAAVPTLCALLEHDDEAIRLAAAASLERIAGPVLREEREVPFSPHAAPGSRGRPMLVPRVDAPAWRAYFRGPAARLSPTVRHRWGQPLGPAACLAELGQEGALREDRETAAFTLAALTGQLVRFDADDWVAKQRELLASLRDLAAGLAGARTGCRRSPGPRLDYQQTIPAPNRHSGR